LDMHTHSQRVGENALRDLVAEVDGGDPGKAQQAPAVQPESPDQLLPPFGAQVVAILFSTCRFWPVLGFAWLCRLLAFLPLRVRRGLELCDRVSRDREPR